VPVNLPSVQAQVEGAGSASLTGGALQISTAIEGEYIAAATRNVPVRGILGGTTFGLNTIAGGAKSLIKGGLVGIAAGLAFDQLLKGIDWVMADGKPMKQSPGAPVQTNPGSGDYYYTDNAYGNYSSASDSCLAVAKGTIAGWGPGYSQPGVSSITQLSDSRFNCTFSYMGPSGIIGYFPDYPIFRYGNSCPAGSSYSSSAGACLSTTSTLVPVADADYGLVDAFVNAQNSDFVRNLLKQTCQSSLAPARCYDSMKQQALALQGPSSVPGETTTKSTTIANPDGATSNVVTTDNTNYAITYGPNYFDYTKTTQSNTTTNGKPTSSTTTSDASSDPNPDPTKEQPSDPVASPCGTNCDGPAYQKLYQPTTDTKEQALDSYASRVADLPILKAATGFFSVSVGGGCPVWQVNTSLEVLSASMPINLIFDFHCQGWFTSVASYASAVMAIVCAFLAFRQAFLD